MANISTSTLFRLSGFALKVGPGWSFRFVIAPRDEHLAPVGPGLVPKRPPAPRMGSQIRTAVLNLNLV